MPTFKNTKAKQNIPTLTDIATAIEAHKHYKTTGLHTTHQEMKAWVSSLTKNFKTKPPVCHK